MQKHVGYIFNRSFRPAKERRLANTDFMQAQSAKFYGLHNMPDEFAAIRYLRGIDKGKLCTYHNRRGYVLVKIELP